MSQSAAATSTTSDSSVQSHRTVPDASSFQIRQPHSRCGRRRFASCRRRHQPAASCSIAGGAPGAVGEDWTFQIKLRPGPTRLNVMGQPEGWVLKAIRHQGSDVTDAGIDVKPNEDIREIEVELTNRITDVSGLVMNSRGEPAKDYWAVLFARDRGKWQPQSRYIRTARPIRMAGSRSGPARRRLPRHCARFRRTRPGQRPRVSRSDPGPSCPFLAWRK